MLFMGSEMAGHIIVLDRDPVILTPNITDYAGELLL